MLIVKDITKLILLNKQEIVLFIVTSYLILILCLLLKWLNETYFIFRTELLNQIAFEFQGL